MDITKEMIEKQLGYEINDFKLEPIFIKDEIVGLSVRVEPKVKLESIIVPITITKTKYNVKEINGNEIIKYLNSLSEDDDMDDIGPVLGSFVFDSQTIKDDRYNLTFTASYNNWGTHQEIHDNYLFITEDEVSLSLEEPFDGDGSDEVLEIKLTEWLKTHKFEDQKEYFDSILSDVYETLPGISFNSIKDMDEVIEKLIEAKSLMKEL
jgi:hypothetical protein